MTRKTYRTLSIATLVIALAVLVFSCKKDEAPNIQSITFEREYFQYTPTTVTVSGVYAYDGRIDGIKMQVGQRNDLADARTFNANLDGTHFTVLVNNLQPGAEYHYCYEVDYGFSKPYKTETKTFATPADSPLVKTLEVMALDSTTVRINCETVSDGGLEITERGVCWNTYGNPNLDDESLTYTSAGLGQYSCRISGLAHSTKYYIRAYAKNASGIGFGEVLEFETLAEAQLPEVSTVEVDNVTSTTATCMGNVASDGGLELTERGVCWSLSANPTISGSHAAATDASLGVFEVAMTGLTPNKTYHVRAYATNAKGTAYGDDLTFTTTEGLPVVTTTGITEITATSAKGGGEVTDQGASNVTERGICWSTSHNPTTNGSHANSGTGTGSFTVNMTGLTANTTYYVRAYAINSAGTAYGSEVSFTTQQTYTISVSANPTNGGTVSGGGTYQQGQSCTVHATANSGYTFINWTEGGSQVSTNANYTFTVTGNRTFVANFTYNGVGTVDLGLPSGLLWATCNVGADSPEDYGDYFAWGETQPKSDYSWSTYQHCMGNYKALTKYCSNASYGYNGFTDNLTTLLPEDDAATANWGSGWRMPTKEEWRELLDNTTNIWTTQNGVNGRLFTAANGNSLFLPAAGERNESSLDYVGMFGNYWSSSLNTVYTEAAFVLYFGSSNCEIYFGRGRKIGLSVRPVRSASKN